MIIAPPPSFETGDEPYVFTATTFANTSEPHDKVNGLSLKKVTLKVQVVYKVPLHLVTYEND